MSDSAPASESEKKEAAGKTPAGPKLLGRILGWALRSKVRLAAALSVLILAGSGFAWRSTRVEPPTPAETLGEALELLDRRDDVLAREKARETIREMQARDAIDSEFSGGVEFVLGMAAYHDAEASNEAALERAAPSIIRLLTAAERLGLREDRRPEWAMALGASLLRSGSPSAARPLLEEAAESAPYDRENVLALLIDVYLDVRQPEELEQALALSRKLTDLELSEAVRDRAWLQRAQIHMARNEPTEAEAALKNLSERSWTLGTRIFNAQTQIARGEFREAIRELEKVAADTGRERTFPRQASYLIALSSENAGDVDAAIAAYERTASKYDRSHEALASQVRAARLLQRVGRHEEAVKSYRAALRAVRNIDDYRNRWMSLGEFRAHVVDGWDDWLAAKRHDEAILLARAMPPAIDAPQAKEYEARARQAAAEAADPSAVAGGSSARERAPVSSEARRKWQEAGVAWAELAALRRAAPNYVEILWASAEAFRRGHALPRALEMLDAFIATEPKRLLPMAIVRRGEVLFDLDKVAEARAHFERVTREFATDPAVFTARRRLGDCAAEVADYDGAVKAWRAVLSSPELTPDAEEWRGALFALGRLLCHRADQIAARLLTSPESDSADNGASETDDAKARRARRMEAWTNWDEAARVLDEFVRRYPDDRDAIEARGLLARSLSRSAERYRTELAEAETENARQELQRAMDARLEQASEQLQTLRTRLLEKAESSSLGPFHTRLLTSASFEAGHVLFSLRKYEPAIVAYNGAINRYPNDPAVFLACLQLAECYERTGRPFDARSMVQQARIIHSSSDDVAFSPDKTALTRDEWNQWIDWATQVRRRQD